MSKKFTPEEIRESLVGCHQKGGCTLCIFGNDPFSCNTEDGKTLGVLAAEAIGEQATEIARLREERRWIPVSERLPENEVDVLILAERRLYGIPETDSRKHHIVAMAFHTDGKMNTEDSGYNWELWDTGAEYDEEADAYIIPEGWWESVRYGEEFSAVDDFVTHWMPLPEPPKEENHGKAD